jgi:hypothetical protein
MYEVEKHASGIISYHLRNFTRDRGVEIIGGGGVGRDLGKNYWRSGIFLKLEYARLYGDPPLIIM